MKSKVALALVGILACAGSAFAEVELDIQLSCPTTVKAGYPINVTVKPYNYGTTAAYISRYMAIFVANTSSNTLGGTALYGPFAKTITARTVPARNNTNYTPGTLTAFSVPVGVNAPAAAVGKMGMVVVNFINSIGQELAGESCMVQVIP